MLPGLYTPWCQLCSRPTSRTLRTHAGSRTISIDAGTVATLKAWKKQQTAERLLMGVAWHGGHDLVVTESDGSGVHPEVLSRRFKAQAKLAGIPIIRSTMCATAIRPQR